VHRVEVCVHGRMSGVLGDLSGVRRGLSVVRTSRAAVSAGIALVLPAPCMSESGILDREANIVQ